MDHLSAKGEGHEGVRPVSESRAVLHVQNISKHFGGLLVIDDLTFSVRGGKKTALIGPNGAGKTTVFNLITGVVDADNGKIFLDDEDITLLPSRNRVGRGVARTFQG